MSMIFSKFWRWYNSHKTFNTGFTAGLFVLQLVHTIILRYSGLPQLILLVKSVASDFLFEFEKRDNPSCK